MGRKPEYIYEYGNHSDRPNHSKYTDISTTLKTTEKKQKHAQEALQNKTASKLYIFFSSASTQTQTHIYSR